MVLGVRQRSLLGSWAGLSAGAWDRVRGQESTGWRSFQNHEVRVVVVVGIEGQLESRALVFGDRGFSLLEALLWGLPLPAGCSLVS